MIYYRQSIVKFVVCLYVSYFYYPREISVGSQFLHTGKHNNWGGFAPTTGFLSYFIPKYGHIKVKISKNIFIQLNCQSFWRT